MKAMQDEGQGYLLEYQILQEEKQEQEVKPKWLEDILTGYVEVFKEPQGLPPSRRHDRTIVLKECAYIPNLRHYR